MAGRATSWSLAELKQVIGVTHFSTLFVFGGWSGVLLMIGLLFTRYWFVTLAYALWRYLDRKTHVTGGRAQGWMRYWGVWGWYRDYFAARLVKTHDLDPRRNYIVPAHPHGVMCFSHFLNFGTEATGFSRAFPGLQPHLMTLSIQYKYPLFREYMLCSGSLDVCKESLEWQLENHPEGGQALSIVVGGAAEVLLSNPGVHELKLKNRKGFIKMALRHGASLVPMYSFGETDLFRLPVIQKSSWGAAVQRLIEKVFGYTLPYFYGRSKLLFFVPNKVPLYTVVGAPIHVDKVEQPSQAQIDDLHARYVRDLCQLFDTHKHVHGIAQDETLVIS